MKKQISCILAILMAMMVWTGMAVSASGEVWINNGNFEDGMAGWTVQTEGAASKFGIADAGEPNVSKVLQYVGSSHTVVHVSTVVGGVETGKSYTVRAKVYYTTNETIGTHRAEIGTSAVDCNSNNGYRFIRDNATDTWFEIERTFIMTGTTFELWIGFCGTGTWYLDDVTIERAKDVPVIASGNGNLETGDATGWTCNSDSQWDVRSGGVNNSNAIYINLEGNSSSNRTFTAPITNVEKGKLYTVKLQVKVPTSGYTEGANAHIGLIHNDPNNESLPSHVRYVFLDNIAKDVWVELKYAFVAEGEGQDKLIIKFRGPAKGYIDDCTVTEGGNILDTIGLTNSYSGDFMYTTGKDIVLNTSFGAFGWARRDVDTWGTHLFYDTETYASYPASMKLRIPADEAYETAKFVHGYYLTLSDTDFDTGKYKVTFKMKSNIANETVATWDDSVKLSVSQTENWETKVFYVEIPEGGVDYVTLRTARDENVQKETIVWFDDVTVEKIENESGFINSKGEEIVNAAADETVQSYFSYVPEEGKTPLYIKAVYGTEGGVRILKDFSIVSVTAPIAEIVPTTLGDACEIKMMVWDSISGMKLIMAPKKLTLAQ